MARPRPASRPPRPTAAASEADATALAPVLEPEGRALLDSLAPELVYERYSLWGRTATAWASCRLRPTTADQVWRSRAAARPARSAPGC